MRFELFEKARALVESELERRRHLVDKALRDPERFLADARSPYVRRAGELAERWGWFPAASRPATTHPRAVPRGLREKALEHAAPVTRGALAHVEGNRLRGEARSEGASPVALVVHLDSEEIARFIADGPFDVCVDLGPDARREAILRVSCAVSGVALEGTPRAITVPRYIGALTRAIRGRIHGYVYDAATGAGVHLDVVVDGRVVSTVYIGARPPRLIPVPARIRHAFAVRYVPRRADSVLEMRVRGSSRAELGTPRSLEASWPAPTIHRRASVDVDAPRRVHIVVPVYAGTDITLRCVDSVVRGQNSTPWHMTVIWDAGPDPELLHALRKRADDGRFVLLENADNLGFVRTCNRGMRLHTDEDVILLNADTEVSDGWLDRLTRAGRAAPDIGTATPFSNAASICTFPSIGEEVPLPQGTTLAEIDGRFARVNAGQSIDLPTGHGFCLFLRRAMLDVVGLFDEEAFGRGYGEENDLCLRGRAAGFRSVLACDVFVVHVGSVSFGAERDDRVRTALRTLARRYPSYAEEVASFIRCDPPSTYRNRVVADTLKDLCACAPHGGVLLVTHHLGGGIEVNVVALSHRLVSDGFRALILASHPDGTIRLRDEETGLEATFADSPELESELLDALETIGLRLVHVHHVLTLPDFVPRVIERLGVPFDVTLHDFFFICPRVQLMRASGSYCGEPDVRTCDVCIATDGPYDDARTFERSSVVGIDAYRSRHLGWLMKARRVVTPSKDTAKRIHRVFPSLPLSVLPHPEARTVGVRRGPSADGIAHVAVLGGIERHKGYRHLVEIARHANDEGLPIRFVVFGTTLDSGVLRALPNVTVTGRYTRDALPALVARSRCNVAVFLSIWPETYSYTLSEALELGLYPVCFDIGAPAERLAEFGYGTSIPPDSNPATICRVLMAESKGLEAPPRSIERIETYASAGGYYDFHVEAGARVHRVESNDSSGRRPL